MNFINFFLLFPWIVLSCSCVLKHRLSFVCLFRGFFASDIFLILSIFLDISVDSSGLFLCVEIYAKG